jgi:hypothetical protein
MSDVQVQDFSKWSDAAIGQLEIDPEEVEHAMLVLARAAGIPEPVLYDDVQDETDNEDLLKEEESEDQERMLDEVVDLQERMATGMVMIQDCEQVLSRAKRNVSQGKEGLPYAAFMAWVARRKQLWSHWWMLKAACDATCADKSWLWGKYFELKDSIVDRAGYSEDVNDVWLEQLDNMEALYAEPDADMYQD